MGSVRRRLSSHGPWVVCSCAPRARARRVRRRSPCTDAGGSPPDAPADSLRVLASPPGGLVRCTPFLALVIAAGCARPPRAAAPPQTGLLGPSSQPVLLPPRQFEAEGPRTDVPWRAVGPGAATPLSPDVACNTPNP